ncbi:hypothetical protein C8F04DRAFT_1276358 [Mycena alexandri]|uniref:F-box domain-containing protein n=1 Tax=Mycena alexandri TaxID=1745969 RepID=A0AAD6S170_9AGAR|nr:hypothetical protein C8F04DRAFT_1276358 [Mycena alexandri]
MPFVVESLPPCTLEPDRIRAAKLDAEILDLKRSLSTLQAQRELVQERIDSYKYPVLTLPNEIVAEIFGHCLPNYPECPFVDADVSPINLTQICRDWRDIALATPTLWRAMQLYLNLDYPVARQLRDLEVWLSRSGCCPMSVDIVIDARHVECNFSSAHCVRWEVLTVFLPPSCLPITAAAMPLLRQLDLTILQYNLPVYDHTAFSNLTLAGEMPLLRSVILNAFAADSTSNLVSCKLVLLPGGDSTLGNTTLPCLKSLVLTDTERFGNGVTGYLEMLIVPALRELDIVEVFLEYTPIHSLASFISKCGCQLQKVTIGGLRNVSSDAYRTAFPSIEFASGKYD